MNTFNSTLTSLVALLLLACSIGETPPDDESSEEDTSAPEETSATATAVTTEPGSSSSTGTDDESSSDDGSSSSSTSDGSDSGDEDSSTTDAECVGFRSRYDACGEACSAQCKEGLTCRVAGDLAECTEACETDDQCGAGTCSGGFCILFLCGTDEDCPGGMFCYPGDGEDADPTHPDAHCLPQMEQ
jgi:hypothetical protein